MGQPVEAETLVQDTGIDAAASWRIFAWTQDGRASRGHKTGGAVRRRPPTGRGHARSVFQGPIAVQLVSERSRLPPDQHRALAWLRDPPFHRQIRPVPVRAAQWRLRADAP